MNCSHPADRLRFLRLCGAVCNQTISSADFAQLEAALSKDALARQLYIDYLQLHHCTADWARGAGTVQDLVGAVALQRRRSAAAWLSLPGSWFSWRIRSPRLLLGVVSVLLVGYFLGMMALIPLARWAEQARLARDSSRSDSAGQDSAVGQVGHLTSTTGEQLANPPATAEDAVLVGRKYTLKSGEMELELPKGVRVRLRGPARWQMVADDRLSLGRGTLVATVSGEGIGFTVVTPSTQVIDLGTEFAVTVEEGGTTDVQVMQGRVQVRQLDLDALENPQYELSAGDAVRVIGNRGPVSRIAYHGNPLTRGVAVAQQPRTPQATHEAPHSIPLGNLLDDPAGTPIHTAIESDEFLATAEIDDLGIERVLYGGDAIKRINRTVEFDLTNLGWEDSSYGNVSNDTWTDHGQSDEDSGPKGGIRTTGALMNENEPKCEEGIGTHANALITFDLDELRTAAGWQGRELVFRCDRAGINDDRFGKGGSVNMAVLISDDRAVLGACLNGEPAEVSGKTVHSFARAPGNAIRDDGRFVTFSINVPPHAHYLTLVAAGAGDAVGCDHAVWSGARLEILK